MDPLELSPNEDLLDSFMSLPASRHIEETGFVENWQMAAGQTIDSDLSFSKLIHSGGRVERNSYIMQLREVETEILTDTLLTHFTVVDQSTGIETIDYDLLAEWLKANHPELGVKTSSDLQEDVRHELKIRREMVADVFSRQSSTGFLGQMGGSVHGFVMDPLLLPTYFVGVGEIANVARSARGVLAAAARVGLVEGGIETLRQPHVMNFKHDVGVDWSITDAVASIAMSSIMAGGMTVGSIMLGKTLKKMWNAIPDSETSIKRGMKRAFERHEEVPPGKENISAVDQNKAVEDIRIAKEKRGPENKSELEPDPEIKAQAEQDKLVDAEFEVNVKDNPDLEITIDEAGNTVRITDEVNVDMELIYAGRDCL